MQILVNDTLDIYGGNIDVIFVLRKKKEPLCVTHLLVYLTEHLRISYICC